MAISRLKENNEDKLNRQYSFLMNEIIKEECQKQYIQYPKNVIDRSIDAIKYTHRENDEMTKFYARERLHQKFQEYKIEEIKRNFLIKQKEKKENEERIIIDKLNNLPKWQYEKVMALFLEYKNLESSYNLFYNNFEKEKNKKQKDLIFKEISDILGLH